MFTVENSILLPAPLARVWRLVFDVNRYRDWHPDIGLESDPNDPKKLIYTYWRPGWADPIISVEGSIVRLKRPSEFAWRVGIRRSEEHTSELQSLMRISYAVFCLKKKKTKKKRDINSP